MKRFFISILLFMVVAGSYSQSIHESKIVVDKFLAPSLQGNRGGEDPNRRLTIYLPAGYEQSKERYPVLYFLHGFASDDEEMFTYIKFKNLMDSAIKEGRLRPCILVLPNSLTKFYGSFYTNSSVAGNWADFIGKDVVEYIDKNYRSIANRNNRGLFGHSMGGYGALKIAMLYAHQFSAVYAMSAGALHFAEEFDLNQPALKALVLQKNIDSLRTAVPHTDFYNFPFFEMIYASLARMYSPNDSIPVLQANLPVRYTNTSMEVNPDVVKKWEENFPINMIGNYLPALKSLTALKMDWGRNEQFIHIPVTNLQFSKKLEAYGIRHFAEEYIGDHVNMLDGFEGRVFTEVLPFFERYLEP